MANVWWTCWLSLLFHVAFSEATIVLKTQRKIKSLEKQKTAFWIFKKPSYLLKQRALTSLIIIFFLREKKTTSIYLTEYVIWMHFPTWEKGILAAEQISIDSNSRLSWSSCKVVVTVLTSFTGLELNRFWLTSSLLTLCVNSCQRDQVL